MKQQVIINMRPETLEKVSMKAKCFGQSLSETIEGFILEKIEETIVESDYPKPRKKFLRKSWVVEVSIPNKIRHLFNASTMRKTAGRIESDYDKKVFSLTKEIYNEFDRRQHEHNQKIFEQEGKRI